MKIHEGAGNGTILQIMRRVLLNTRALKYFFVGCAGIAVNLGTMAILLAVSSRRGWVPSAIANVVSTVCNFYLHNLWTFADRQHQGSQLVRGFVFFALMSSVGIGVTTGTYVVFIQIASHLTITKSHISGLVIPLACQALAIPLGAVVSYVLNKEFTWPQTKTNAPEEPAQVQEI
jgi:putative flippase GtrA